MPGSRRCFLITRRSTRSSRRTAATRASSASSRSIAGYARSTTPPPEVLVAWRAAAPRARRRRRYTRGAMEPVEIATWRPELRAEFERLNRAWLEAYGLLEEPDLA